MKKDKKSSKEFDDYVKDILSLLDKNYLDLKCSLNYKEPYELLFSAILSAQCTDIRVNLITKNLFEKYKNINDFANVESNDLEKDIKSAGFYRNKAKNIILCAKKLIELNNKIPDNILELKKFPGVGRKTANVIRSHVFKIPCIVVDTHVKRISNRLKLTQKKDPEKIEFELMNILPENNWLRFNMQIINHGRKICSARKPDCKNCFLNKICKTFIESII
ncbi:MAG: endonuclease III [Clostridiales bacterium]|nr:endonuclease III [Clostridiales bacterium]